MTFKAVRKNPTDDPCRNGEVPKARGAFRMKAGRTIPDPCCHVTMTATKTSNTGSKETLADLEDAFTAKVKVPIEALEEARERYLLAVEKPDFRDILMDQIEDIEFFVECPACEEEGTIVEIAHHLQGKRDEPHKGHHQTDVLPSAAAKHDLD